MTERYAEERAKSSAPADPDVRRYYDEHFADFVTPTRVHVSHLFLAAAEKDAKRAAATALARPPPRRSTRPRSGESPCRHPERRSSREPRADTLFVGPAWHHHGDPERLRELSLCAIVRE
jgi:hypothetical protein